MIFKDKEVKEKTKRITLQIRLKESERNEIKELAEKNDINVTEFIKQAINTYSEILNKDLK